MWSLFWSVGFRSPHRRSMEFCKQQCMLRRQEFRRRTVGSLSAMKPGVVGRRPELQAQEVSELHERSAETILQPQTTLFLGLTKRMRRH
jgi:hypothetical protein